MARAFHAFGFMARKRVSFTNHFISEIVYCYAFLRLLDVLLYKAIR